MKIPKLCRNGDGRAFVIVPKTRKRIYFGPHGKHDTERKYDAWCSRLLADGAPPPTASPHCLSVQELARLYIQWAERHYVEDGKPTKTFKLQEAAAYLIADLFADKLGKDVGPSWVETIQGYLLATPSERTGKPRVRTGINDCVNRCRQVFRWWARREYIAPEKYAGLRAVESLKQGRDGVEESDPVEPVDQKHVNAVLPFMPPPLRAMVEVQRLSGMRPQDVCGLRPCDIDRSGDIWIYTPPKHKTAHRGHVLVKAIPRAAQALLQPFLDRAADSYCFSPQEAMAWRYENQPVYGDHQRKTPLYPSETRRRERIKADRRRKKKRVRAKRDRYDTTTYRRAIEYAIKRARKENVAVDDWAPNQLRHSIATEISRDISHQAATRYLGHRHLKTSATYIAVQTSEVVEVARKLDQKWNASRPPDASTK